MAIISFVVNLIIYKCSHLLLPRQARNKIDDGPQHIHSYPVLRLGGIGIILAGVISFFINDADSNLFAALLYGIPIFLVGMIEDLCRNLSANKRLLLLTIFSTIAAVACGAIVKRTDILGLDWLLTFYGFSIGFSTLSICGLINAYNIIDGLNGLSSLMAFLCLSFISLASYACNDMELTSCSLIIIGAIFGFALLNFPFGKIFLGDCGAYWLGYICAIFSIFLVMRNPSIPPVFAFCINIYPIAETLHSIFRRIFFHKSSFGAPDFFHLHSLIFKRLQSKNVANSNPKATLYVVLTTFAFQLTCLIFYKSSAVLVFLLITFIFLYIFKYNEFKSP